MTEKRNNMPLYTAVDVDRLRREADEALDALVACPSAYGGFSPPLELDYKLACARFVEALLATDKLLN